MISEMERITEEIAQAFQEKKRVMSGRGPQLTVCYSILRYVDDDRKTGSQDTIIEYSTVARKIVEPFEKHLIEL